jgi:hypothetical protein
MWVVYEGRCEDCRSTGENPWKSLFRILPGAIGIAGGFNKAREKMKRGRE